MTVAANVVYVDGRRSETPHTLDETYTALGRHSDALAWIGLVQPDESEVDSVATEFGFHHLAVEDAVKAHQRPKIERYGDVLFTVLRTARYDDAAEAVVFDELHVFTGHRVVVTVRHGAAPDLPAVRRRLEDQPALLRRGPEAVLYAILDQVVDEYAPVVEGLQDDIDEIEDQLFAGDPAVSRRIYALFREVLGMQRATDPLLGMIAALTAGATKYAVDDELQRYLRDVHDHVQRLVEQVGAFRELLQNALAVNATVVAQRQNEEMEAMSRASLTQNEEVKKISGWAAILFAPTLVGTVYGMNFAYMPELDERWGYPVALGLMLTTSIVLFVVFRARRWL